MFRLFENNNQHTPLFDNHNQIGSTPTQVADNRFIGQQYASSGEIIYLCMELITPSNKAYWEQYLKQAFYMANSSGRCLLPYLAAHTKREDINNVTRYYYDREYNDELKERLNYSQEEFDQFINYFGKQGYTADNTLKKRVLEQNSVGSHALSTIDTGKSYIVYATKTPNFFIQSTTLIQSNKLLSLKEYLAQYNNILMCVGADFSLDGQYHNRGIFRNPYSVIENTHKGIAMLLHGFSGAVAKLYFKDKKEMIVRPVSSMQYLICTSLNPNDYSIEGNDQKMVQDKSQKIFSRPGMGEEFPTNHIKIDALANYYYTHQHSASLHTQPKKN